MELVRTATPHLHQQNQRNKQNPNETTKRNGSESKDVNFAANANANTSAAFQERVQLAMAKYLHKACI